MKKYARDYSLVKDFTRKGYGYYKREQTDNYMVWTVTVFNDETGELKRLGYEVWKRKLYKNPDGSIVWRKPSDEEFGRIAWYYTSFEEMERKIGELK